MCIFFYSQQFYGETCLSCGAYAVHFISARCHRDCRSVNNILDDGHLSDILTGVEFPHIYYIYGGKKNS